MGRDAAPTIAAELFERFAQPSAGTRTTEVEVKVRVSDPRALAASLPPLVVRGRSELQVDHYFRMPHPQRLRLREVRHWDGPAPLTLQRWGDLGIDRLPVDSAVLTHKQRLGPEPWAYDEEELQVVDLPGLRRYLADHGMAVEVIVRKHRTSYHWDEFTLELNTLPDLGTYLDVELLGRPPEEALPRIRDVLARLGFVAADEEPVEYVDQVLQRQGSQVLPCTAAALPPAPPQRSMPP